MREPAPSNRAPPLAGRLIRGTVWTVAMQWGIRALGLLSMVVLARLLAPEDFGLHAMAMAVVALVDVLTDLGLAAALIRDKRAGQVQFDTAWTIRQLQLLLVAAVVAAGAPLAAEYYGDTRVTAVLQVVAIALAVRGFENIGVISFRRDLMFQRDFVFEVAVKFSSVAVTLGLAVWLRSYWALALGIVAGSMLRVAFSYWMSPYRPRWCLAAWRELWEFSQWVLSQGLARYIYERSDVLFLGRLSAPGPIGYYMVSNEAAQLPASGIALPVSRAVFPGFAQLVDEPRRLRTAYLSAFGAVAAVAIPIALAMAGVAHELIALVLGEKWLPAVGLLQVFAMFSAFWALTSLSSNLLVVLGYIRYNTAVTWVQAVLLVAAIVPIFNVGDLIGVALLRTTLAFLGLGLVLHFVVKVSDTRWRDLAASLLRPVLAGMAMLASLVLVDADLGTGTLSGTAAIALSLVVKLSASGALYLVVLFASWHLAGRPDGIEALLARRLRRYRAPSAGARR